jgi:hypothetical protein
MMDSFPLEQPAPFEFRPLDKNLYYLIRKDPNAKIAFERMTRGPRAIEPSWLLYVLGVELDSSAPEHDGDDRVHARYANDANRKRAWERWNDALQGLNSNAKTLRRISTKMKIHLAEAKDWLPGEYGYSMRHPRGEMYHSLQKTIWGTADFLIGFTEKLNSCSKILEAYCFLGKEWRKVAPQADEKEVQRTFALLLWVRQRKGGCHFELMAPLINVGRRLRGEKQETAESLRSLWRREMSSRRNTAYLGDLDNGHRKRKKSLN